MERQVEATTLTLNTGEIKFHVDVKRLPKILLFNISSVTAKK